MILTETQVEIREAARTRKSASHPARRSAIARIASRERS
jgi:hypothetical protein